MSNFETFQEAIAKHFDSMADGSKRLFAVEVDKEELYNLYLDSFPKGTNEIFRERREHDCNCCKHFIRRAGNVVSIKNGKLETIWDVNINDETYQIVANALSAYIKSKAITDVFLEYEKTIGCHHNIQTLESGDILTWHHFYANTPSIALCRKEDIATKQGQFRDSKNVFKRSLDEITEDSVEVVLELIAQNSLYRGEEHKGVLLAFLEHKRAYSKLKTDRERELYAWEKSVAENEAVTRIKNHSIGTLISDISNGVELDKAVNSFESKVAPANYKRPKAIFTKKMLEDAENTVKELGYMDSLERRHAKLDDISVNNILFTNKDSAKKMIGGNIFDDMKSEVAVNPKKFSRAEEIGIKDFIENVLPTAKSVELLFENKYKNNLMSLTAPENKDSKSMFKWNNSFAWAYNGNLADSNIKENVKKAGGEVKGDLRFSIQWNDDEVIADRNDNTDLDAHCVTPSGEIYYIQKRLANGELDVDIIEPCYDDRCTNKVGVENIIWKDKNIMPMGKYRFFVHCYGYRNSKGFKAEIEFNNQIYRYEINRPIKQDEEIEIADVCFNGNDFDIVEKLPSDCSIIGSTAWGLNTNQFVPVSTICYSPNYWDEQNGIGNRHYFFILKDCKNPERINGIFNEYLKNDLNKHKRVFEALGSRLAIKYSDEQMSGVGFSSTMRNDVIVKVKGNTERVLKIKF